MTHVKTLNKKIYLNKNTEAGKISRKVNIGCGECKASCQSACKTSCTVANQACENISDKK